MELDRRAMLTATAGAALVGAMSWVGAPASAATSPNPTLRPGSRGSNVGELQTRLTKLGYWCGTVDRLYGALTTSAIVALQKVSGLGRDGICGPLTWDQVIAGTRPKAATRAGHVVEVHRDRQVLLVVNSGMVRMILAASTGSEHPYYSQGRWWSARTTPGSFRVLRSVDSWYYGSLGGLYRPMFFNGGIAVHGYTSVPTQPASHGCVRVSLPAMDYLWATTSITVGTRVTVY